MSSVYTEYLLRCADVSVWISNDKYFERNILTIGHLWSTELFFKITKPENITLALCKILRKIGKIRKMGKMKNFQRRGLDYFIQTLTSACLSEWSWRRGARSLLSRASSWPALSLSRVSQGETGARSELSWSNLHSSLSPTRLWSGTEHERKTIQNFLRNCGKSKFIGWKLSYKKKLIIL